MEEVWAWGWGENDCSGVISVDLRAQFRQSIEINRHLQLPYYKIKATQFHVKIAQKLANIMSKHMANSFGSLAQQHKLKKFMITIF